MPISLFDPYREKQYVFKRNSLQKIKLKQKTTILKHISLYYRIWNSIFFGRNFIRLSLVAIFTWRNLGRLIRRNRLKFSQSIAGVQNCLLRDKESGGYNCVLITDYICTKIRLNNQDFIIFTKLFYVLESQLILLENEQFPHSYRRNTHKI